MRRLLDALRARLGDRRALWLVPLLGCLLVAPSLGNGLDMDDLVHRYKARGVFGESAGARLDLFSFWPGDPAARATFQDLGYTPWFATPDLKIAFYRPLSAALAALDYNLLDGHPGLMHAESVLWYGLLALAVLVLLRRFLPAGIAGLAGLLYAIDDAHGYPVGWLANRNAVLATLLGVLALWAHDRWRRDRWRAGALLGPLAFAAALAAGELAVGALGYLVAHALFVDPAPARGRRALALAPYLVLLVAWQVAYRKLGFGTHGSGWYVDPIADLGHFVQVAPGRAIALLLSAFALPPADLYGFAPAPVPLIVAAVGAVVLLGMGWIVVPRVWRDPTLRFFLVGSLLAVVPVLPGLPADRLLFFVGIGVFAIVARLLGELAAPAAPRGSRAVRIVWIGAHMVIAPLLLLVGSTVPAQVQRQGDHGLVGLAEAAPASGPLVVLVNMPNAFAGSRLIFPEDREVPRRARVLATAAHAVRVTRDDARTLTLVIDEREQVGPLLTLFRSEDAPLRAGDRFEVPHMQAEILSADASGVPRAARFRFEAPLEDASYAFIAWNGQRLERFTPPPVGATVSVGAP